MSQEVTTLPALLIFTANPSARGGKAFCRLGALPLPVAQEVAAALGTTVMEFNLLIDSDGIRHTLAQHGVAREKAEIARGQIPITEADLLDLANWLHRPTAVCAGQAKPGKQPRVEMQWETPAGTTVAIMEWRPGRQQLALVTMYKKSQPPKQLTFFYRVASDAPRPKARLPLKRPKRSTPLANIQFSTRKSCPCYCAARASPATLTRPAVGAAPPKNSRYHSPESLMVRC